MNIKLLSLFILCTQLLIPMSNAACVNDKLTRQIVIDIFCSLTTCCEELKQLTTSCDPTFIMQTDIGTTGTIITTPGIYFLAQDIAFAPLAPSTAITIDSDNVFLDLQCATLSQTNIITPVNGIRVVSGRSNIIIRNGLIEGFTADGIIIEDDTSFINCENTTIRLCDRGIALDGSALNPITNIALLSLDLKSNTTGLAYYFTQAGFVKKCKALSNVNAAYDIRMSFSNKFIECFARDTENVDANAYGVYVDGGAQNIFEQWRIEGISTQATFTGNTATGFFIGSSENELTLKHSQIHNCLTTNDAQPFGIQMEYVFTTLSSSAFTSFSYTQNNQVTWSANNRYIAIAGLGDGTNQAQVLELVNETTTLLPVASANYSSGVPANSVSWSPDNLYLAVAGNATEPPQEIKVFTFNGSSLTQVASAAITVRTNSVDWSADGRYIAIGSLSDVGINEVKVFEFTGSSLTNVANFDHDDTVLSVNWSPNGHYLAIGGDSGFDGNEVRVLEFTGTALNNVATFNHGNTIEQVSWSPNGTYLSIAGAAGTGGFTNRVLEFTGSSLITSANFNHGATLESTAWSPDGIFVLIAGAQGTGGFNIRVLEFTGNSFINQANITQGTSVQSVEWSPTGQYVVAGVDNEIRILSAFQFPHDCTILDNIITTIHGAPLAPTAPGVSNGRGLSASSGTNLIIQNTTFDSDINYVFVTDIFQQFLVNVKSMNPSVIENLSMPPL